MEIFLTVFLLILSYLLGSIPFGLIMGKLNGVDIREHGSKNIGTTNTIRVLGKPKGLTAFIFEVLKGTIVIIIVKIIEANGLHDPLLAYNNPFTNASTTLYILYGAPAIIGHVFPIYLKFKGGKAIAVSLGVVLSVTPIPAALCLVAFLIFIYTTGYVSLGSTAATLTVVISTWILYHDKDLATCIIYSVLSLLLIFKHKTNYVRLMKGTENKTKFKQKQIEKKQNKEKENDKNDAE